MGYVTTPSSYRVDVKENDSPGNDVVPHDRGDRVMHEKKRRKTGLNTLGA